jgi:hypothetical protein
MGSFKRVSPAELLARSRPHTGPALRPDYFVAGSRRQWMG